MPEDLEALALLGLWIFAVIQFGKGKAWPDKVTIYLSLLLPLVLAAVVTYGTESLQSLAANSAKLFLYGTGFWAVSKAAQKGT